MSSPVATRSRPTSSAKSVLSSLSLFGRATNVWRVRKYLLDDPFVDGDVLVLKTARRSSERTPKSDIYLSIEPPYLACLTGFICGGDARFPEPARFPITVQNLRNANPQPLPDNDHDPTPVLRRLFLGTLGRPMWEYQSDRDLFTGFRDALQAHRNLCDQGILHRDISAGNILLAEAENAPVRGFFCDLDFALVQSPTETTSRNHTESESTPTFKRGAGATGTTQFMARELLNPAQPITHQVTHDVQSFIWVLSYSVILNLHLRASHPSAPPDAHWQAQRKRLHRLFLRAFFQIDPDEIAYERTALSRCLAFPRTEMYGVDRIVAHFMSDALVGLFLAFQILLQGDERFVNPVPLTHDAVIGVVEDAIASL
ncbi:hypothetical protein GALMADRAFT_245724 [Galerina marginata CBS 339.88]|uniref:Protein kinase domain-containing protein n=1 Tax=Galerina marginata (strain CBS 339.88) TaxID=685588 RepID=A0A067T317_GALM3|nr:hypothetical protein GALMADRAFT_245724 [Galerina marginata CBS 339.88]